MNDWEATAVRLGGISRSVVFQLWAAGELGSVKIGRRRFSTDTQISDYIRKLEVRAMAGLSPVSGGAA